MNITAAINSEANKVIASNWKTSQSSKEKDLMFTADDVLNAWHDGRTFTDKAIRSFFNSNINKAFQVSENLVSEIDTTLGIKANEIHLKPLSPAEFKVLIIIDSEIFLSDKMIEAYKLKNTAEDNSEEESFSVTFSFFPFSENLTKDNILSDGFYFEYVPKG